MQVNLFDQNITLSSKDSYNRNIRQKQLPCEESIKSSPDKHKEGQSEHSFQSKNEVRKIVLEVADPRNQLRIAPVQMQYQESIVDLHINKPSAEFTSHHLAEK